MGAPDARRSTGSFHAIANVLGAGVQLNCDCLDSARGLVTVDAALVVSRGLLVIIEKKVGSPRRAVQPMQAKRRCTVEAPDADDIWASSMDSEFKMDSSWKLAE